MKRICYLFTILLLAACNTPKSNTPSNAVLAFFEAARKGNINELKQRITSQDAAFLEMGQQFMRKFDSSAATGIEKKLSTEFQQKFGNETVTVSDEKIDGDKASVLVHIGGDKARGPQPFALQKENGEWKVSLMASGLKASGKSDADLKEGMKDLSEGLKNLPAIQDSIEKAMKGLSPEERDSLKEILKTHKGDIKQLQELMEKHQ